jgi:hypothetical protein
MKRETLALETPACSATSSMVTRLRWAAEKSFTVSDLIFSSESGVSETGFS